MSPEYVDQICRWLKCRFDCRLDLAESSAQRIQAARDYLKECDDLYAEIVKRLVWDALPCNVEQAAYYVAEARVLLAKMEQQK